MEGLLAPGPTRAMAEELRKRKGSRGLLGAVGEPMAYAPNPVVAALGQGLLGAQYLTGEKELGQGLASLSDMTAMMVGSRLPPAMRKIFAGVNAKTADKAKLAEAEALDRQGVDNRAIWQQTGWFKGPDKKWRFEIDDSEARLKKLPMESIRTNIDDYPPKYVMGHAANRPLGDIFSHDDLYAAYPNAAKHGFADVEFGKGLKEGGKYRRFEDIQSTPTVPNISVSAGSPKKARSVLLHEVQHGVQEGEGFARGGTPENAPIPLWDEISAIRTQKSGLGIDPYKIQNKISGGFRVEKSEIDRLKTYQDLTAKEDALLAKSREVSPHEVYRRLAGEAEARAVQSRMNMTKQQRGMLFPLDSYDVPLDQLIFR